MNPNAGKVAITGGTSMFEKIREVMRAAGSKMASRPVAAGEGLQGRGRYIAVALDKNGNLSPGRHHFAGKRLNPHWNKTRLTINSRAIELTEQSIRILHVVRAAEGRRISGHDLYAVASKSAEIAADTIVKERHAAKTAKRERRLASLKVQRGTIQGSSRAAKVAYAG